MDFCFRSLGFGVCVCVCGREAPGQPFYNRKWCANSATSSYFRFVTLVHVFHFVCDDQNVIENSTDFAVMEKH
jgi:hypothetical protein